jgi:cytochrome c oxidase subunit 7
MREPALISTGYHVPAVRHRDAFYQRIEDERARALGQS